MNGESDLNIDDEMGLVPADALAEQQARKKHRAIQPHDHQSDINHDPVYDNRPFDAVANLG